jgi:site-specific DNA recombinase
MRAVIYCRVSSQEQVSNLSLPTQEKACRDYCQREGYDVAEVFVERGETAKTADRPEFLRLLQTCRTSRGRLHGVVVYALSRFSRNSADHHAIAALLRGLGIALRSVTEPIDDSPAGRFMEAVIAGVAQFDNDMRSARTVAGMKAAIERGRWVWMAPIGYRNAKGHPSLVQEPAEAVLVRTAFELYAGGLTEKQARAAVVAQGLRTQKGRPISSTGFAKLLRNPAYMGLVRAPAWKDAAQGDFEPIVPPDLFARVQQRLHRKRGIAEPIARHRDHPDFPLRRFVRCGTCEVVLTGSWSTGRGGRRYAFYSCRRCQMAVRKADLEQAFVDLLDRTRPTEGWFRVLRATVLDEWHTAAADAAAATRRLERQLVELRARLSRVEDLFIHQQAIDRETYQAQRDHLREDIALAQLHLNAAATEDLSIHTILDDAEHVLRHSRILWLDASPDGRQRLQWALFPTGLAWTREGFGTAVTDSRCYQLDAISSENPRGEPHVSERGTMMTWLQTLAALRPAA